MENVLEQTNWYGMVWKQNWVTFAHNLDKSDKYNKKGVKKRPTTFQRYLKYGYFREVHLNWFNITSSFRNEEVLIPSLVANYVTPRKYKIIHFHNNFRLGVISSENFSLKY